MAKYRLEWTETLRWESIVEAKSAADAKKKLHDDTTQENAEVKTTIEDYQDVTVTKL